jgi:uncharacterized SAM-dependent methyltransferase
MREELPNMQINPGIGDYFKILDGFCDNHAPSLFLFLGGNIGNYVHEERNALLSAFSECMKKGDLLLIGIDLIKNPRGIQQAYEDPHGVTRKFNLNLLRRINRELEADIDLEKFDFYCNYDPRNGEVNSYLVSLEKQRAYSKILVMHFNFANGECIWTEVSKKYSEAEIDALAAEHGFTILNNFTDSKNYFTDSLWKK